MDIILTIQEPHVHLKKADIKVLFGEGAKLTQETALDMPGTYKACQTVIVKSRMGELVLPVHGPSRTKTKVELSREQMQLLGIPAAETITLAGGNGSVEIPAEAVVSKAHVHMPPEDASTLGVLEGGTASLKSEDGYVIEQADVRVSHMYARRLHIITADQADVLDGTVFHTTD